ncbi:MAG TPA: peptide ABC transporter substrate-binding protein [Candidatus Limnocylindrales bacterium]|nr:peptide ABC transporter substrate-binding protein [Candidatus Limnocylindrales bacterium]
MTRRDRAVVLVLVLALAVIAGAVVAPSFAPVATPTAAHSIPPVVTRPYREGVLGRATQVSPLTASTRADRDLVALVFSGLVKLGPGNTLVSDLASDWTTDAAGRVWTFRIRGDARWQDGIPVTANDVAFTIGILQDPAYTGPGAASWRDVTVRADDERTVRFDLSSPIGGFLQAATQPIVPEHRLRGVPVARLARDPFGRAPTGSGPFRLTTLDASHAVLEPATFEPPPQPGIRSLPTDSLATQKPTPRPERQTPALHGMEFTFFDDTPALSAAWRAGDLDAASGLPAADATILAAEPGSRLIRYPSSTLTAVVLNVRKTRPEFRDPRVRLALLKATDRATIVRDAYAGAALRADAPIPPGSWAFDQRSSPQVGFDATAARKDLIAAGWEMVDGKLLRPGGKRVAIDLLTPDVATNTATFSAGADIAAEWQALGLDVTQVPLSATELFGRRLRSGDFVAAVVDVNVGLDPDLYPLLASTQVTSGGLNLGGQQDPKLDALLVKARAPGTDETRKRAYMDLEDFLAKRQYLLPIAFRDELVVARDTLVGPAPRQVGDPSDRYWDVLTWRLAVDG